MSGNMREHNMYAIEKSSSVTALKAFVKSLESIELPKWLAMLIIMALSLVLSGCFSARQTYGVDQNAIKNINAARSVADPTITGSLPAGQNGWTPRFYRGTGVKPGQNEVQSEPFTPKGIGSAAGLPPKPKVAPVDLPAPPLPLPESTAAPSTTLFGRAPIGRQSGASSRGSNFGGTALGWQPRFHQPSGQSTLKVFPNQTPPPAPGFRVATRQPLSPIPRSFNDLKPQPLPFPNLGQSGQVPQSIQVLPQRPLSNYVVPAPRNVSPRPPSAPVRQSFVPQRPNNNMQVFNQPVVQHMHPPAAGPTFKMNNSLGQYPKAPIPKGSNLIVTGNGYQIDTGDQLNIRVLGQADLTGQYRVDSSGSITMPMISTVFVRGKTVSQISNIIQSRLRQGFLRTPSVAVEVNSARPFYILGQVKNPGKYNFVNGLTVSQAVAIAGGYQPRAKKGMVRVTRQTRQGPITAVVPNEEPLMPGDTIYVKQRWF